MGSHWQGKSSQVRLVCLDGGCHSARGREHRRGCIGGGKVWPKAEKPAVGCSASGLWIKRAAWENIMKSDTPRELEP